jgi:hypothetical protein
MRRQYDFEVLLERPTAIVQGKLSALRDERLGKYAAPKRFARYLPSQYLADSSLGAQSQQLDGISAQAVTVIASETHAGESAALQTTTEEEKGSSVYMISEGELDIDELNRHECMVCGYSSSSPSFEVL